MRAALALLAISACGGARAGGTAPTWPHGVAYGADARAFVAAEPVVVTGDAPTTECAELADCVARCALSAAGEVREARPSTAQAAAQGASLRTNG